MLRSLFRRKYRVTVMDNWTGMRHFWTLRGAHRFACRTPGANIFVLTILGWNKLTFR